jgi:hypothetical protein
VRTSILATAVNIGEECVLFGGVASPLVLGSFPKNCIDLLLFLLCGACNFGSLNRAAV